MQTTAGKTILITGANTGLGKETARQLALRDDFERIYLGCRNPEKAERAKEDLEKVSGRKIFEVVIIDLEDVTASNALIADAARRASVHHTYPGGRLSCRRHRRAQRSARGRVAVHQPVAARVGVLGAVGAAAAR